MPDRHPITTRRSKVIYQNPWITVYEDETTMPSGKPGIYGYMESKDSVMTAVVDKDDRVCLVKAFRYPSKSWGWELPGGGGEGENPIEAAKRELREETGIVAERWEKLGETLVCNGFMTERMVTCLAYGLSLTGKKEIGEEALDGMSFFSLADIDSLIDNKQINDGQTLTGLYFLQRWLRKRGTINV